MGSVSRSVSRMLAGPVPSAHSAGRLAVWTAVVMATPAPSAARPMVAAPAWRSCCTATTASRPAVVAAMLSPRRWTA
ncbi:MAG TPA: hypothetical protein VGR26_08220 [Acidimicrobiales bacterium]|nr:hypothetical protein [Acidimicrobiales bacterium]